MSWNEVVLEINYEKTVSFSDALLEAGAMAVTVEDAAEGTDEEKPIFGEPGADNEEYVWKNSRIIALLPKDIHTEYILQSAAKECGMNNIPSFFVRNVPAKDWVKETQSQFAPIHVGQHIWIIPSWHDSHNHSGTILRIDPGLAFGTGSHPTTHLCLEWLEKNIVAGQSVLDYGCGSGILAIAASKLGASSVDGVDIDPQAVTTAKTNAKANQCHISFYQSDPYLKEDIRLYDVVIANILSGPLQQLSKTLVSRLKPNGKLLLSGILDWQKNDVISAYSPWLVLSPYNFLEGWVALSGTLAESAK